jgi:hypothetical protein
MWKPAYNLPGYEVSSLGELRSVTRFVQRSDTGGLVLVKGQPIKHQKDKCGYLRARLSISNKKISVKLHRVVALTFIENPMNLAQVNHKDGDKTNNKVDNLEWISNQDNQIHAIQTGLKVSLKASKHPMFTGSVLAYNKETGQLVATMQGNTEMKNAGFDYRLVSACLNGKRKSHNGCYFVKEFCNEV